MSKEILPMKVLVTGCSGYLGNYLCQRFSSGGFTVMGVDLQQMAGEIDDFILGDFSISEEVRERLSEVDCLIHTAAISGV